MGTALYRLRSRGPLRASPGGVTGSQGPCGILGGMRPLALVVLALAAACSTPADRINRDPELFSSFPPEAQAKIREGKIELGFTKPMVEMALGRPDERYSRRSAEGPLEVWGYGRGARGGVGADIQLGGGASGGEVYGLGGVGIGTRVGSRGEQRRVVFREGKVVAIEDAR